MNLRVGSRKKKNWNKIEEKNRMETELKKRMVQRIMAEAEKGKMELRTMMKS